LFFRADVQKHLRCLSRAAESIAAGDTVDAVIRRAQKWTMLPTQVSTVYSSYICTIGPWAGKLKSQEYFNCLTKQCRWCMGLGKWTMYTASQNNCPWPI